MLTPKNIVAKCDFCDQQAVYDGKTKFGPWAYMCERHRQAVGVPGTQLVQRLDGIVPKKRCSICGAEKPLDQFYKYNDHSGTTRYRSECKVCNLQRRQIAYHNKEKKQHDCTG